MLTPVRVTVLLPHHDDDEHIGCPYCGEPAALYRSPLRRRREWTCPMCGATGAIRIAGRPAPHRRPPTRTRRHGLSGPGILSMIASRRGSNRTRDATQRDQRLA